MNECGFTYQHYVDTVKQLKNPIIRHDVDLSLNKALEMARIENKNNIKSIYFILTSNPLYNVMDEKNTKILQEMVSLGHEIGLHYDLSLMPSSLEDRISYILTHSRLLGNITKTNITKCVAHNPVMGTASNKELHDELEEWCFKDMNNIDGKYISDSGHNWREGCFCNFHDIEGLHVNTHPEWWNENDLDWFLCYLIIEKQEEQILTKLINDGMYNIRCYHDRLGLCKRG